MPSRVGCLTISIKFDQGYSGILLTSNWLLICVKHDFGTQLNTRRKEYRVTTWPCVEKVTKSILVVLKPDQANNHKYNGCSDRVDEYLKAAGTTYKIRQLVCLLRKRR